jgi:hypothetical protein
MPRLTEETTETGVIYKITNKNDNKYYIGKAKSFRLCNNKTIQHGANGRFNKHYSTAQSNIQTYSCKLFCNALKDTNKNDWTVEVLKICMKEDLKKYETKYIKKLGSHNPDIGYNYFVGDGKPINDAVRLEYEQHKATANRNRAENGKLKRNDDGLPANIYKRTSKFPNGNIINGYFVQIKIGDKLINKAFMSSYETDKKKLKKAKEFLANIKLENDL